MHEYGFDDRAHGFFLPAAPTLADAAKPLLVLKITRGGCALAKLRPICVSSLESFLLLASLGIAFGVNCVEDELAPAIAVQHARRSFGGAQYLGCLLQASRNSKWQQYHHKAWRSCSALLSNSRLSRAV